jgi:ribosomal protein S18 acetylase RimI-like enzyme
MTIAIRDAGPADEAAVLGLTQRLADFPYPSWRTAEEIVGADREILLEALRHPAERTSVLVAEDDTGAVIGCAFSSLQRDYFTGAPHVHLEILAVGPRSERRGIARALVQAVEAWARRRGCAFLTLNVFASNARARAAYDRLGFVPETLRYRKAI